MFIPVSQPSKLTRIARLFIPVEEAYMQHIYVIDKNEDGSVTRKKEYGVQYVPLTDAPNG
jgi:protein-L-isoaspartate(D-aspartate) O-methyltransferase